MLDCRYPSLAQGPLEVEFQDAVSSTGAEVSRRAWVGWLIAVALALSLLAFRSSIATKSEKILHKIFIALRAHARHDGTAKKN